MADKVPEFVFYRYPPSMAAAIVFVAIFAISALTHISQLVRKRTWYFIPFLLGCLFEGIGYLGRALSSTEHPNFTKVPYIVQSILLLLGPTLFAASIYMILGRLANLLEGESYSIIPPKWLTKVFVLGDILSFFAQGGGGGMLAQAKSRDDVRMGENVIIGGLGIQILFFGFFMVVTMAKLLVALYVTSFLIMVRSVYRVVEYVTGSEGELMSKEAYLYCLDALPILVVALTYNWFHPSRVIDRHRFKHVSVTSLEVLG
ncbi:RTA1 like protein [Durotheca rogersii]|uniref:RTA1 like protein n=1 Tax=Durotheca rogersii TaxID=419775 RepID=UPI00221F540B|nr:RTA1 like protein [Durotheca rogersii]KAI5859984.1 RTA1 like protein [Durotheca rogersii]